ncbi:PREDICTED: vascular cell adhesion protein 1 isoform X1 [Hipposideros armiger]|uniref:Vascular cell adhesion protein 1 n=1 Tax=Hipposideros armiger TaxID=186990 RepID=A0A8B7PT50_HIPAR|nr:PREDICTED: vascular cell adhesion protein 1 isoform X1 [Hipposideros armiger]
MPRKMVVIFGASNILWMVFAVSQAFKIEVFPESEIVAQIGASVSLVCSTTGCESPSFSWRTQIDSPLNAKVRNEGTKSTLIMDPVSFGNEHSYLCTATCESQKAENGVKVHIYSFPKDPEINLSGPLEIGKPVTVTCLVSDVYPFDRLEIYLSKGDHVLKMEDFIEPMEKKSLETKSLKVTFTPTNEDTGKALVCQAKLYITEIDDEPQKRETTRKLQVNTSPKNTVISVNPSTRLQEGGSVTMTCTSEGLPAPQISWSKKLDNGSLQYLSGNATLTLIAMRMEDSGIYVCEGVNLFGKNGKEVELIVEEKLFTVEISPGPQIAAQIGDSVVLTCGVTGCKSPSFAWRTQTDSPLSGKVRNEGTTSMLILSPVSFEDEHSYLCTVTCGHKKQEKRIRVDLYSFPRDPEIEMSSLLVSGNPVNISCKVPNVYPSDQLEIELLKGESVMKTETFLMDVHKKSLENKSLEMTFIPTTEDTGKVLVCQAKLHIGETEFEPKQRQSTQTLHVKVAPKDIQLMAFPSESVKEGDTVIISCTCGNVPQTWIILKKKAETGDTVLKSTDGAYTIHKAQLEDAGVYECESKNEIGLQLRSITLDVKVPPRNTTISVHPSRNVKEGENITITCKTFSHPPAVITLKRVNVANEVTMCSKNGIFTLYHVTQNDTGVYVISASNEVGDDSGWIEISVKRRGNSKDYFSPELLVLYCASSLIIPAIGMIIYFARKANMKGSYSLVEAQKSKV